MIHLLILLAISSLYAFGLFNSRNGNLLFLTGMLTHAIYILSRWVMLDHIPLTCRYDILSVISFFSALSFIYLVYSRKISGIMNILPLLPILFVLLAVFQDRIDTINPNMNSHWFYIHMIFYVIGFALMGIGSVLGALYLKDSDRSKELIQYRFTLAGWLLFSFSLIAGSVWFYLAYGVYWLWTAKELWTTIVWFYYGFYLHARTISSLKGWMVSEIGAAGFIVMLFAYLGVTPILGSPWTQF
jgi:ABC-type transport system involved in cytochrome c biogenesis permease subunit